MAMVSSKPLQRIPGITVLLMEWKSHESHKVNDEMANVLVAQILYLANQDKGATDRGDRGIRQGEGGNFSHGGI